MHIKTKQTEAYFNETAAIYDETAAASGRPRDLYPLIVERALDAGFSDLLDIACGTGNMLLAFSEAKPEARLTGIDLSDGMLAIARERLGDRAELSKGDATALPFADASFDVITCNHAFHHFPEPLKALREWNRVLRPGGTVIIGENRRPFLKRLYRNCRFKTVDDSGDVKFYSRGELLRLARRAGFEAVTYTEAENFNCLLQGFRAGSDDR